MAVELPSPSEINKKINLLFIQNIKQNETGIFNDPLSQTYRYISITFHSKICFVLKDFETCLRITRMKIMITACGDHGLAAWINNFLFHINRVENFKHSMKIQLIFLAKTFIIASLKIASLASTRKPYSLKIELNERRTCDILV